MSQGTCLCSGLGGASGAKKATVPHAIQGFGCGLRSPHVPAWCWLEGKLISFWSGNDGSSVGKHGQQTPQSKGHGRGG